MAIRQITEIAKDDPRLKAYTNFETKHVYFRWGSDLNLVVITPDEAKQFASWLLQQAAEIDSR